MTQLSPVAFDIETNGFCVGDEVTVAGLTFPLGSYLLLFAGEHHDVHAADLETRVEDASGSTVKLDVFSNEAALFARLETIITEKVQPRDRMLTGYNAETWSGGFDFAFLRSRCAELEVDWPFQNVPYVDLMSLFSKRVNTQVEADEEATGLAETFDTIIGEPHCDPFEDSGSAVTSWKEGDYLNLLLHNLADIERTQALADWACDYVPASDFQLKNLSPPSVKYAEPSE